MDKNKLLNSLQETNIGFRLMLEAFESPEINKIVELGCWSAGQVAEHVYKSDEAMLILLTGPVRKEDRAPDEKIVQIEKIFLDFETKLQSPSFIIPSEKLYEKDFIISRFLLIRAKITEAAKNPDLGLTCTAFPFPGSGELTRLEILNFIDVHTRRHTYQLEKLLNQIRTAQAS